MQSLSDLSADLVLESVDEPACEVLLKTSVLHSNNLLTSFQSHLFSKLDLFSFHLISIYET
jgi:hypothetical protein